jgi:hypothetical protein
MVKLEDVVVACTVVRDLQKHGKALITIADEAKVQERKDLVTLMADALGVGWVDGRYYSSTNTLRLWLSKQPVEA